jgi:hypothetical protein
MFQKIWQIVIESSIISIDYVSIEYGSPHETDNKLNQTISRESFLMSFLVNLLNCFFKRGFRNGHEY